MTTDEELRSAWTRIRRPGWPESFEGCMTVPLIAVQVRIEATRKRHYQPPPPRARIQFNLPSVRPVVDLKRIASGDKDD